MGGIESTHSHLGDPLSEIATWVEELTTQAQPHTQQDEDPAEQTARKSVPVPDAMLQYMDTSQPLNRPELFSLGVEICRMHYAERDMMVVKLLPAQQDRCCAAAQEFCDTWKSLSGHERLRQERERGLTEEDLANIGLILCPGMLQALSIAVRRNRLTMVYGKSGSFGRRPTPPSGDAAFSTSSSSSSSSGTARHHTSRSDQAAAKKKPAVDGKRKASSHRQAIESPPQHAHRSSPSLAKPPAAPSSRTKPSRRNMSRRSSLVPLTHTGLQLR
mmetsp:Transcript_30614/g.77102  ORF Transcript_30614/g.77102 Transcript_30614/m.77102 type:complete len:273 (+) Transcript_30614:48-866(+)|eukprot:CAMPEP_0173424228 /NCGR_PEP_ID=MMETSP1357-20121228/4176_1 /TAXON_ID=77926 /ORGANISM="Hemiselmis rufescens, Strain PCC563" /LENGTH=272 /DNA_ID=CAMNT_0014387403 /DNA_START=42 /DNA_END=860 /DNA_ORIENTATION=+